MSLPPTATYDASAKQKAQAKTSRIPIKIVATEAHEVLKPSQLEAWRIVGEGVKSCPRAGCGKSARPVR